MARGIQILWDQLRPRPCKQHRPARLKRRGYQSKLLELVEIEALKREEVEGERRNLKTHLAGEHAHKRSCWDAQKHSIKHTSILT